MSSISSVAKVWSQQQQAIFDWFRDHIANSEYVPNLVVRARAGTGKTTTIVEAVNYAPEDSILLAAFNKSIATELGSRVRNPRVECATLHSIGFRQVKRYWGGINVDSTGGRAKVLTLAAINKVGGPPAPDIIVKLISKLHTIAREVIPMDAVTPEFAANFDCLPDDEWIEEGFDADWCCKVATVAMELAAVTRPTGGIDFADMIFLPVRNSWMRATYDMVVVDEAQDMNNAQLTLAQGVLHPGGRMCIVGDDRQAIYGFRGADSDSIDRLKHLLSAEELPLTITYRCAKSIVAEAQRLVPDFTANVTNPMGSITTTDRDGMIEQVKPGDFILSRINAPMVSVAMELIRNGTRTMIKGRDIGAGLKAIVKKTATGSAATSIPEWIKRLNGWRIKELDKAEAAGSQNRADLVQDQSETLLALSESVTSIEELVVRIDTLFKDDPTGPGFVICSSVHRAKGLEADRVFVMQDTLYPGGNKRKLNAKRGREESNIEYVAITRAKQQLIWVNGGGR